MNTKTWVGFTLQALIAAGTLYGYCASAADANPLAECAMFSTSKTLDGARLSHFAQGKVDSSVFKLDQLGNLIWALYDIELRKRGFVHETILQNAASFSDGLPALEAAAHKSLGDAMFEKLPWDVFAPARYGRMVWESNSQLSLAPERIYLETRGWLQLAGDVLKNLPEIGKVKDLVPFKEQGSWKVWSSQQGFIALHDQVRLVGAECSQVPDAADFDRIVADLSGAKP